MLFHAFAKAAIFMLDFGVTGLICMAFAQYNSLFVCAAIPCGIVVGIIGVKMYDTLAKGGAS